VVINVGFTDLFAPPNCRSNVTHSGPRQCGAKIYHMMRATASDLRYRFAEIEARLRRGEEVEIRKREQVIARLVPVRPKRRAYPDFAARQRKIFGDKIVFRTGAEVVASDRDRY